VTRTASICDGRSARNQAAFAQVNAAIEKFRPWYDSADELRFLCECSDGECAERIVLMAAQYELLQGHALRFPVAPAHDDLSIERIIEKHDGYWVVEKFEPPL
jgi:hypothetical protein